jgi:hypothetical protein
VVRSAAEVVGATEDGAVVGAVVGTGTAAMVCEVRIPAGSSRGSKLTRSDIGGCECICGCAGREK